MTQCVGLYFVFVFSVVCHVSNFDGTNKVNGKYIKHDYTLDTDSSQTDTHREVTTHTTQSQFEIINYNNGK